MLEAMFEEQCGRYIRKITIQNDPELVDFTTSLPQTEYKRKLIVSNEKDFSDSKVDIKIYLCTLHSKPGCEKIQVEIFTMEEPSLIFRCDFFSRRNQKGKQVLIEKFNLAQWSYVESCKEKLSTECDEIVDLKNQGLVLSISETSFPHEFNFMLLEPCSHIFWHFTFKDNKLNQIERRMDRQVFAHQMSNALNQGILRNLATEQVIEVE